MIGYFSPTNFKVVLNDVIIFFKNIVLKKSFYNFSNRGAIKWKTGSKSESVHA